MAVDRKTGDVFVFLSDKGLYQSTDLGKTWSAPKRVFKGRTETPGCIDIDPVAGSKRMNLALVYGSPVAVSSDLGQNWKILNNKSGHVDWCVVDWTDADMKFMLALKHESGGTMLVCAMPANRLRQSARTLAPPGSSTARRRSPRKRKSKTKPAPSCPTAQHRRRQVVRPVADYSARALPCFFDGVLYWLTDDALISSGDKGKTWKKICDLKNGRFGPVFGKTAQHSSLTTAGVIESTDAGASWTKPLALPKEMKAINFMTWLDYDPVNDVLHHADDGGPV